MDALTGIDIDRFSLSYASVDHLAARVVSTNRGCFLVKANIKETYMIEPVHLLGVRWESAVYIDKVLPFDLRSAPKIFSAIMSVV